MKQKIFKLTLKDFARFIGTIVNDIPKDCRELIAKFDSRCRKLNQAERDKIILDILKRIDSPDLSISGDKNKKNWEKGWKENLQNFIKSNYDINELVPKYVKSDYPIRLYSDYVMPFDAKFELHWCNIFRQWLFKKYFKDVEHIYDFGCGTGLNLVKLAKIFPQKKLYGLDWVKPSMDILKLLAKKHDYNIKGYLFDMFAPDETFDIQENSGILAWGALEQMGHNFEPFLQFILKKSPRIFVLVNTIVELYDESNLVDYLAIKFNKRRNYLEEFLPRLRQLETEGKIEILKIQKVPFGTLYLDGFSFIVWRSKKV